VSIYDIPEMVTIYVRPPGGEHSRGYHFHHEGGRLLVPPQCTIHDECRDHAEMGRACWASQSYPHARKLMSARARPDTIAAFVGLADFFGGAVDFQDCDDVDWDHVVPDRPVGECAADDGSEWTALQRRLASVISLTRAQIRAYKKHAAYDDE
jgi:hypothetical protein